MEGCWFALRRCVGARCQVIKLPCNFPTKCDFSAPTFPIHNLKDTCIRFKSVERTCSSEVVEIDMACMAVVAGCSMDGANAAPAPLLEGAGADKSSTVCMVHAHQHRHQYHHIMQTHTHKRTHTDTRTHTRAHVHTNTDRQTHIHTCTQLHTNNCARTYTQTQTDRHTYTHVHSYTQTIENWNGTRRPVREKPMSKVEVSTTGLEEWSIRIS